MTSNAKHSMSRSLSPRVTPSFPVGNVADNVQSVAPVSAAIESNRTRSWVGVRDVIERAGKACERTGLSLA